MALWELPIPGAVLTILVPLGFATLFLILDRRGEAKITFFSNSPNASRPRLAG